MTKKQDEKVVGEPFKTDPALTVEGQMAAAKEVDQGESARQLLEQALPYVGNAGYKDYSGSPEYVDGLRERIKAYLLIHKA